MKRAHLYTVLTLLFVTFASLGATECTDEERMAFRRALGLLAEHEQRLEDLERCDCVGILQPVCGADGNTYVNRCEARCAETPIVAPGACEDRTCGGDAGMPCDEGSFCESRPGCDAMALGMCEEIPEFCEDDFAPVCGCDGVTYSNDCERRAAGIPIDFRGDCDNPPVECDSNDECMDEEFCRKRKGVCDSGPGICSPLPAECSLEFDPVCGCDGESYANACAADASGVAIASEGACGPVECSADSDCADDEYCGTRVGLCGGIGLCRAIPEVCPQIEAPVCGCNDVTYGNKCLAASAGVALRDDRDGCGDTVPICHFPPGNRPNFHTIFVEEEDVRAHLANHGDHRGRCEDDDSDSETDGMQDEARDRLSRSRK